MATSSLTKMTVPLASDQSNSNQGLLMPKLKYRFRVSFQNFGVSSPVTELTKQVVDFTRPNVTFDNIDLPTAGEVDLQGGKRKKTQSLNKSQHDSKKKRESQSISAISRSSKSSGNSSINCTEKSGFKIESICEAESDQEIDNDNDNDNGEEEGKEESSRDRRLLKALFDGYTFPFLFLLILLF
jgi:hypothetical protein